MRQAVVVLLVLVIIAAGVAALLPRPWVRAQDGEIPPIPTVRSLLKCAPTAMAYDERANVTVDVAGSGFPRGSTVAVFIRTFGASYDYNPPAFASIVSPESLGRVVTAEGSASEFGTIAGVDDLGTFRVGAPTTLGYGEGFIVVAEVTEGPGTGTQARSDAIRPCPLLEAQPRCSGGKATSIQVKILDIPRGIGETEVGISIDPDYDASSVASDRIPLDGKQNVSTEIPFTADPGVYYVFTWFIGMDDGVEYTTGGPSSRVDTRCPSVAVDASPACEARGAPPSRMALRVTGTGFHPGRPLEVVFDPGRSYERWIVDTDRAGRFDTWIYPYRRSDGEYLVRAGSRADDDGLEAGDWEDPMTMRVAQDSITVPCPTRVTPPPAVEIVTPPPEVEIVTPPPDVETVTPPPTPPPTVPPRPEATLTTEPTCVRPAIQGDAPRLVPLRLRGRGWDPGPITIDYDPPGNLPGRSFTRRADPSGQLDDTIEIRAPASGTARITARQKVAKVGSVVARRATQQISATARVASPCRGREPPPLTIMPTCGVPADGVADAYTITVIGTDFYRGSGVSIRYGDTDRREWFSTHPDTSGQIRTTLVVDGRREELVPIVAEQLDTRGLAVARASARLTVPCPIDPSITIEPEQGPAGYTTLVTGDDFWPGTTVTLRWDTGIDAGREYQIQIKEDGTFETYLLIMHNDWPGDRVLRAGMPGEPDIFPDAKDDYLVVPGSGQPSGESGEVIDRR